MTDHLTSEDLVLRQYGELTPAEAARFGDVVAVAIPFGRYREVPREEVIGKVVIDANNYYLADRQQVFQCVEFIGGDILQLHLEGGARKELQSCVRRA